MTRNTNTKIRNERHIAVLGCNYLAKDSMSGNTVYPKGHTANTVGMYERNGEYIVEGHGIGFIIPRELFTRFYHTWEEVTTTVEGNSKVTKVVKHKVDETKEILAWWDELDAKAKAREEKAERVMLRSEIANLRRIIKNVKNGKTEKELARLMARFDELN